MPVRLAAARGRVWIATDAGLVGASGPEGPWQRARAPVGHRPVSALAGAGPELVVATRAGLFALAGDGDARPVAGSASFLSRDPPVQAVHGAALRHLGLEPRRMRELAAAADRSGWLPELRVDLDHARGRDRGLDFDEAFIAGDRRFLFDREERRFRDYGIAVQLEWDLGETVFHPDRLDVSREARLVAQLRDDVLDEINQLYFERQRVLAELADPSPETRPAALRLRAAELAAGIDAWTGGWFSARLGKGLD